MKRLLFLLVAILALAATAQEIDSLKNELAKSYEAENDQQVIEIGNKLLSLLTDETDYVFVLNPMAMSHYYLGDYAKAVELGIKLVEIQKRTLGENHPDYATSLNNLANYYSDLGDYAKAIELGTQALEIRKRTLGENHPDHATSLNNLAGYYSDLGDYAKAIELGTQAVEIQKRTFGENSAEYAQSLNRLSLYSYYIGDYSKALELGTQAMKIRKRALGEDHPDYAQSLGNLSGFYSALGDYSKAIELGTQALEIRKRTLGEEHPSYAISLSNLANDYSELGDYSKALELGMQAMEIRKRTLGEEHSSYAISLINVAGYYSDLGNYAKAIELGTQAVEIYKRIFGENNPNYVSLLSNLSLYYSNFGNYPKAIELGTQAMEIRKRILGENHPDYATSLNNLATYHYLFGNYTKAIDYGEKAIEIRKATLGVNHSEYATSLNNLASYYSALGEYAKAVELGTQAMEIQKRTLGENHPGYALSLSNLASYYSGLGEYAKALELSKQAMEIRKCTLGENHPDYASSLGILASLYSDLGDYAKAIELGTQVMQIRKRVLGESHPHYAASLDALALLYSKNGDSSKAIELGMQAMNIRKQSLGEDHPDYALSLNNMAYYYSRRKEYSRAIDFYTQALEIHKHILGETHPLYAQSLHNLAYNYACLGNYANAVAMETQSLEIYKRTLGEEHPNYALSLNNLANHHFRLGDYAKAASIFGLSIDISLNYLTRNLSELSAKQRASFWNKESFAFQEQYPQLMTKSGAKNFVGDLYDKSCLFSKGLLLAAETDMRQLILESGDKEAVEKFNELQATRRWLNKLYELPIAERHVSTDSLENVSERLEGELVKRSKAYGDFLGNMKLTWRDVQKKLGDKDIAVEFLSFPVAKDTTQYIALTLRKGYDAPRLTKLFSGQELEALEGSYYSEKSLSGLVWGRLAGELEGVEKIYFSPSGELYNIAIESVPHWRDEGMMSDRFNLYRLSSTRELAITRDATPSSGAVVYGGIKYDTDVALMGTPRNDAQPLYASRGLNIATRNALRSMYWKELDGTKEEADKVSATLSGAKVPVSELTGTTATETTVKDLSGQKRRILHIATHGFYWDEEDAEYLRERDELRFLRTDGGGVRQSEDKALTRSGLIFAGAQNTFNGTKIPAGVDDGVLTAQEIAQLDLRGLDLLVLSACQTGLGDVGGDGVFGLQRGFKKAGARTILMSLREVDDEATRDMMIQFYNAYAQGQSKRDAFLHAQQYLKDHDDEYYYGSISERATQPHWAAFILLDP